MVEKSGFVRSGNPVFNSWEAGEATARRRDSTATRRKANVFQDEYIAKKLVNSISNNRLSNNLVIFSLQGQQMNDRIISALNNHKDFNIMFFVGKISNKTTIDKFCESIADLSDDDFECL